jgi:catechol 2,3-dioxygenase-like lactoylglutathione lyase family enzyme
MPAKGIQHIDLAVSDVERSLEFYFELLGPLGLERAAEYPSYRGTERVTYVSFGGQWMGLRSADGGEHRYYDVGIEHLAFEVDRREEVEEAYARCVEMGADVHYPPEDDRDIEGYYAFFAFDPDGMRVEVFCETPTQSG